MIPIATVIGSNSHLEYVARLKNKDLDRTGHAPGLGDFVEIISGEMTAVGVVFDTRIFTPEIAGTGQRIGAQPAFGLAVGETGGEKGHLLGILVVGFRPGENEPYEQQPPRFVLPHGSAVRLMSEAHFREFHSGEGGVRVTYASRVLKHAGMLGQPLMRSLIVRLTNTFGEDPAPALALIGRSIAWRDSGI
ncbi:MAG: hypothetical protein KF762_04055 [Acidobacteria bacterium]|nr:hypothetical protein [Acidobacteriota bacterium]